MAKIYMVELNLFLTIVNSSPNPSSDLFIGAAINTATRIVTIESSGSISSITLTCI